MEDFGVIDLIAFVFIGVGLLRAVLLLVRRLKGRNSPKPIDSDSGIVVVDSEPEQE